MRKLSSVQRFLTTKMKGVSPMKRGFAIPLYGRCVMGLRHGLPYRLYLLCFAALFLLSSCAAPFVAPTKEFVHTTSRPVTEVDDLVVVVDACMTMDRLKDYISVEDSRTIASYMASSLTSYFDNIGYEVSECYTPFVGSFKSAEETFVVRQQRKDESADVSPPFFIEDGTPENTACQKAYARVIREILSDVEQKEKPPADIFNANETIREDLRLLREHLQKRYILVVIGNGKSVPGLTTFTQRFATGMATGLLTGGALMVSVGNVSYIDTHAAIIDLAEGELLWSNSLRLTGGNVCKEGFYATRNEKLHTYSGWVQNVFFHVPVKTSTVIEAVKNGERDLLEWMLLTGTDLDEGDGSQMTGLHWACQNGDLKTLRLLAKHGANVNCQDAKGDTPLHYAVQANQSNMVKALLNLKADVHTTNVQGKCPLDVASAGQNKKIVKMLNKYARQ